MSIDLQKKNLKELNKESVCALIVTYQPDEDLSERIDSLILPQVKEVIIVDNHSDKDAQRVLMGLGRKVRIHLLQLSSNNGLAAALNKGMGLASQRGYRWVLTLDQDTEPHLLMLDTLTELVSQYTEDKKLAVIGSNWIEKNTGVLKFRDSKQNDNKWVKRKTVITAGSLMSVDVFNDIGPFREDFFIDGIDHEYCFRAWSKGFAVISTTKPLMKQPVGEGSVHSFLGLFTVPATNHAPFRWYFITRNRIILVWLNLLKDPLWSLSKFIRLLGLFGIVILFENQKFAKCKFILLGICDALIGKRNRKVRNRSKITSTKMR